MANSIEINANIAKNLIFYRKAAGMTQAELAEKINYSDKSVSKWESGNGLPDVYTLIQIAELMGVTLNDLVGESTPVTTPAQLKTSGLKAI
jgi:transcriptional regulator with XRE-family HTH domain